MEKRNGGSVCSSCQTSFRVVIGIMLLYAVTSCANMNTISRSTNLPGDREAVHLDIHQRAIIATAKKYCAEPSPDGLAAYAAAIGLSVGKPASEADSLTSSGSSSAASVGLRTQSISLMRDQMYRICEASANGDIGGGNVAVLLGQSQDLAIVILAIEQLTGPVSASQAALIASTQASSTATIASNAKQLEILTKALERANKDLEESKAEKITKENEIKTVQSDIDQKTAALAAQGDENQEIRDPLTKAIESQRKNLTDLNSKHAVAVKQIEFRQSIVDDAITARDKVLKSQDSALASGSTSTDGNKEFDVHSSANKLASDASIKVADTVEAIVKHALNKSYLNEACISVISTPVEEIQVGLTGEQLDTAKKRRNGRLELLQSCVGLINATLAMQTGAAAKEAAEAQLEAERAKKQTSVLQNKFSMDKVMNCISNVDGTVNASRLNAILALPQIAFELSATLPPRSAQQVRTFLATREDQLQELEKRIDSKPSICLR